VIRWLGSRFIRSNDWISGEWSVFSLESDVVDSGCWTAVVRVKEEGEVLNTSELDDASFMRNFAAAVFRQIKLLYRLHSAAVVKVHVVSIREELQMSGRTAAFAAYDDE